MKKQKIQTKWDLTLLYKNTKEDRYVNQNESFSKQFLIKDKIEARDWKMEKLIFPRHNGAKSRSFETRMN